jgi:hypothetical protein
MRILSKLSWLLIGVFIGLLLIPALLSGCLAIILGLFLWPIMIPLALIVLAFS